MFDAELGMVADSLDHLTTKRGLGLRLRLYPLEIGIDSLEDFSGLTLAEFLCKPFNRIAAAFLIIATIDTMTGRQYIIRCISPAFSYRGKVILYQFVPQAWRSTTISTAILEIIKSVLPINFRESMRECVLTRSAPLLNQLMLLRVLLLIKSSALTGAINISVISLACISTIAFWITSAPTSFSFNTAFSISLSPTKIIYATFLNVIIPVALLTLLDTIRMLFSIRNPILPHAITARLRSVAFDPFKVFVGIRQFTLAFRTVFHSLVRNQMGARRTLSQHFYAVDTVASIPAFRGTVPVETTQRKKLFTGAAKFGRGIHSASLSLYLIMLPAGGEIDRFSGATLADMPIIPQVAYV